MCVKLEIKHRVPPAGIKKTKFRVMPVCQITYEIQDNTTEKNERLSLGKNKGCIDVTNCMEKKLP